MNIIVECNFGNNNTYSQKLLTSIAHKTIEYSQKVLSDRITLNVSVAIVAEDEMQKINYDLRGKNAVTDVLSIGDYSDEKDISQESDGEIFLGEVILCYNYIVQIAKKNQRDIDQDFYTVYAHGILHLLGFAHGKKMFSLQDRVAEDFCL